MRLFLIFNRPIINTFSFFSNRQDSEQRQGISVIQLINLILIQLDQFMT